MSESFVDSSNRRPPNAYILFCLEKRGEMRAKHPDLPNIEISRLLGEQWKKLDESSRRPYKDQAKTMQSKFKESHPEYKYDKARKKRQEQELLLHQTRMRQQPPMNFPSEQYLTQMIQMLAQNQPKMAPNTSPQDYSPQDFSESLH